MEQKGKSGKFFYQQDSRIDDFDLDDAIHDEEPEQQSRCQRFGHTAGNSSLAFSFSVQNTVLNMNTLFIAGEQWGIIEPGHEFNSAFTGVIMAAGGVLFLANSRSYYHLLNDFVGKSGGPSFSERWSSLDSKQKMKYGLGVYVSLGKTAISAISTYNFFSSISSNSEYSGLIGGMITGVTAFGNLGCNLSVFLAPKQLTPFMQVEKTLLLKHVGDVRGSKRKIRSMLEDVNAIYEDNAISPGGIWAARAITGCYAVLNANLYLDNTYSFAKQHGAVADDSLMVSTPLFWGLVAGIDIPMTIGNYQGYYPLMEKLFKNRARGESKGCGGSLGRMLGDNAKERLWNSIGIGAALVKTGASTISLIKVGIEMFNALETWSRTLIAIGGGVGGVTVGIANLSIFNQPKSDYTPLTVGPGSDVNELYEINDEMEKGERGSKHSYSSEL